jgi:hypothetical protein
LEDVRRRAVTPSTTPAAELEGQSTFMRLLGCTSTRRAGIAWLAGLGWGPTTSHGLGAEDHLGLVVAVTQAGLGPFFYRYAKPGEL